MKQIEEMIKPHKSHDSPAVVSYFTESRLRELLKLKGPRAVRIRFQEMLETVATIPDKSSCGPSAVEGVESGESGRLALLS
jgi:hypothetical protein